MRTMKLMHPCTNSSCVYKGNCIHVREHFEMPECHDLPSICPVAARCYRKEDTPMDTVRMEIVRNAIVEATGLTSSGINFVRMSVLLQAFNKYTDMVGGWKKLPSFFTEEAK